MEMMRKRQADFAKHAGLGCLEDDDAVDDDDPTATESGSAPSKVSSNALYCMVYLAWYFVMYCIPLIP